MDEYMVELGGFEYAVQATSPEEARQKALLSHVKAVGQQSVQQAEAGAVGRSEAPSEAMSPWAESAMAGMSGEGGAYADPNATGADILKRGAGMAAMAGAGATGAGLVTAPAATLKGLTGGLVGSAAGSEAGEWVGRRIPVVGGETAGNVLGALGGLVGGVGLGSVAPRLGKNELLAMLPGKGGMLGSLMGRGEPAAAATQAAELAAAARAETQAAAAIKTEAQAAKLALEARKVAAREAESAARIKALEETTRARIAAIEARASGKAVPRVPKAKPAPSAAPPSEGATALKNEDFPDAPFIEDSALKVLPFPPAKGTVKPSTNLGGAAKPGPAGTPPDELEETLRRSIEAVKAKKAGAVRGKSPVVDKALDTAEGMHQREATAGMTERVAARRKEVGADKLARELGMDADVIRSDAGDVVGEALGAHSPIIPEKAWKEISAKMLSLPPSERYAYVARATRWARPQIEQLRRTYENLGIAIPVAATGAALASDR